DNAEMAALRQQNTTQPVTDLLDGWYIATHQMILQLPGAPSSRGYCRAVQIPAGILLFDFCEVYDE
ncbi:hypothetical protein ACVBGD_29180, partial [Klebsiella pneumoniae]